MSQAVSKRSTKELPEYHNVCYCFGLVLWTAAPYARLRTACKRNSASFTGARLNVGGRAGDGLRNEGDARDGPRCNFSAAATVCVSRTLTRLVVFSEQ
jgi:hypothetical protein